MTKMECRNKEEITDDFSLNEINKDHRIKRRQRNHELFQDQDCHPEPAFETCCCYMLMNPKVILFFLALSATVQGIVINGIMDLITWNLELRFQFSSASSGLIASFYDIGCLLVVIPVTYKAGQNIGLKPRYISIGLFIMGLGSLICALPHFLSDDYLDSDVFKQTKRGSAFSENSTNDICLLHQNYNTKCTMNTINEVVYEPISSFKYMFFLGQFLHGIGATPLQIIGCTLLSDVVSSTNNNSAFYISIFQIFFVLGPGIGIVCASELLKIYTDFYKQPSMKDLAYLKNSGLFVGAWWIGLIGCWIMAWTCSVIFCIYTPKRRRRPSQLKSIEMSSSSSVEEEIKQEPSSKIVDKVNNIISCTKSLLTNRSYVFCAVGETSNHFCVGFMATFLPKILSVVLNMELQHIGALYGMVFLGSAIISNFISGLVVKLFNLELTGILKMCIICQTLSAIFAMAIMAPCSHSKVVGLNNGISSLACNDTCVPCSTVDYIPVCDVNTNTNYLNPCFAGCQDPNNTSMTNFACVCSNNIDMESSNWKSKECEKVPCFYMPYVITAYGASTFFLFQTFTPGLIAVLKIVKIDQQTFGLGLAAFFVRLLGMIPGPIIFGKVIDLACDHWQLLDHLKCGNSDELTRGSCRIYDSYKLALYLSIAVVVAKMIHVGSFSFALYFSKEETSHTLFKNKSA